MKKDKSKAVQELKDAKDNWEMGRAEMKQEILKIIDERIAGLKREAEREIISQEELNQLYARINELKELKQKIISSSAEKKVDRSSCLSGLPVRGTSSADTHNFDPTEISLCSHCYCMTKTINGRCGKCKKIKGEK